MKSTKRSKRDLARSQQMLVEFVDGPLDGGTLHLDVVMESPTLIRVLESEYVQRDPVLRASAVESVNPNGEWK